MNTNQQQNTREQRGIQIAKNFSIERKEGFWFVPSQSKNKSYKVTLSPQKCECPDYEIRRQKCKHIFAAQHRFEFDFLEQLDREEKQIVPKIAAPRKTYPQKWTAYNAAQTSEKSEFQQLLATLCKGIGEPSQTNGRPRLPFEDMLFACVFKVYSTFSGRRFITDLGEAKEKSFISKLPNYNSIFNYFGNETLTPYLQMMIEESSLPLSALEKDFAIDASGLSATHGFSWHYAKFEEPKLIAKRDWLKIHICTGVTTNVVTAVRVTDKYEHDSMCFEPLMSDTRENFSMRTVSADKAYLSSHNLNVAVMHDAAPFIAFKSNSKPRKDVSQNKVWNMLYHFYALHQDKFLAEYHKRSNVETAFAMIKAKFGGNLRSKTRTAQTNEALCKILAHNLCCLIQSMFEFGIKPDFWKEIDCWYNHQEPMLSEPRFAIRANAT